LTHRAGGTARFPRFAGYFPLNGQNAGFGMTIALTSGRNFGPHERPAFSHEMRIT
jgi:hypothetical protein